MALTRDDGMPQDCALTLDNVTSVPKAFLTERITELPEAKLEGLCGALRAATGC